MKKQGGATLTILILSVVVAVIAAIPTHGAQQTTPPGIRATFTEIGLISFTPVASSAWVTINRDATELSRFLWEPHRYDPAPTEIYLEVFGTSSLPVRLELIDLRTNTPISSSAISFGPNGVFTRSRSANLIKMFPTNTTEVSLVVRSMVDPNPQIMIRRAGILIQQRH